MVEEKKKSWVRRHWILTTVIVIVILAMIGANSNPSSTSNSVSTSSNSAAKSVSVLEKTSGFTLKDCYAICDYYPIQLNTDVCVGNCDMIGKEGSALDKLSLATIQSVKNSIEKSKN